MGRYAERDRDNLLSVNLFQEKTSCLTPFEIKDKCVSLPAADHLSDEEMAKKKVEELADQSALISKLQKQIEKLEADLKRSRDTNIALNVLIDIAEEQGISIRKKAGAKQ